MSNTEQSQQVRNKKLEQLANSTLEEFEAIMKSFSEVSDLGNSEYQFVQRQDLNAEIQQELNTHLQYAAKSGDFQPFLRTLNGKVPDKKEAIILNVFLLFLGETLRTREFNLETLKRVCLLQKSLIDMSGEISSEISNLSEQIEKNTTEFNQRFSQIDQKLDRVIQSIGQMEGKLQATIDERVPQDLGVQIKSLPNIKTFWGGVIGSVITGITAIGVILLLLNSRIGDAKSGVSEAESRLGNSITQVESRLDKRITEVKTDLTKVDQEILDTLKEIQAELKRIDQKIPQ